MAATVLSGPRALVQPLADRDFRLLWVGESISLLGSQFHFVALATLVLALTGSGLALGTVLIAAAIPRAAFMLLGGALTDRRSPRTLMLVSNVLRAVTVGAVAALILADAVELWHLIVLGVVFGTVESIFYPAMNTVVPMLVSSERLPAANALVQATSQLTALAGPAIAGVLVASIGTGTAFALDAASFAVAALALAFIAGGRRSAPVGPTDAAPVPAEPDAGVATEAAPTILRSIREGAAYAFRDPAIRTIILLSAAINLAVSGPIGVGLPWLANVRFGGGPALLGIMFAGFGGGALIGALVAGTAARPRRYGLLVLGLSGFLGLCLGAVGLAPNGQSATALLVIAGLGAGYMNVTVIAWLQARVQPALLGRVMSLVMLGAVALQPVSLFVAGVLVDLHATTLYLVAAATILAAVAAGFLGRAHHALD
jgi:MFS family permease